MTVPLRIRHGVTYQPLFGYRAVREVNGKREYLGPWTTEAKAQAIVDQAVAVTHDALDRRGIPKTKGDTPLDIWTPTSSAAVHDGGAARSHVAPINGACGKP